MDEAETPPDCEPKWRVSDAGLLLIFYLKGTVIPCHS